MPVSTRYFFCAVFPPVLHDRLIQRWDKGRNGVCWLRYTGYMDGDEGGNEMRVDLGIVKNCFVHLGLGVDWNWEPFGRMTSTKES